MSMIDHEYADLRSRRVNLRKAIEDYARRSVMEPQNRFGPEGHDNRVANLRAMLRSTERRWQELHHLLGKRLPGAPVKLSQVTRAAPARPVARASAPYLTRAMFSR